MLPINHAYLPIIGAVAAEMAVGCVWYSDYAFGALYRQATGKKKNEQYQFFINKTRKRSYQILGTSYCSL